MLGQASQSVSQYSVCRKDYNLKEEKRKMFFNSNKYLRVIIWILFLFSLSTTRIASAGMFMTGWPK